jgi:hypothetical protein
MFSWLKRLLSSLNPNKKHDEIKPYYPTEHADTSKAISLDPKNDPFGRG